MLKKALLVGIGMILAMPVYAASELLQAVVASSSPTYTNGDIKPVTQGTDGALRVTCS